MESILTFALTNISTVISQEIKLLGGLGNELQMIKDELQLMTGFLKTADFLVEAHPDVGSWVELVRDVAYDIEDILDDFMSHCTYRHSRGFSARARKVKIRFMAPKVRHQLAKKIQDIKDRIKNISEAHAKYLTIYSIKQIGPSDMPTRYDKPDDASFVKEADLVGIEKPKQEVTEMLLSDDRRRCVISLVGMGGLGKTTLVKKIYDDEQVKSKFSHHAWIRVSRSFKMEDVFKQAIKQLFLIDGQQLPQDLDGMDINGLKQEVHNFLQSKKYLVVLDDVWTRTDWNAIHMAFPTNKEGSRVVITTRKVDIGQTASNTEEKGFIYSLNKLPDEEARELFCRKAFNNATCPEPLEEICQKFLKSCDGLPLAIVVIGRSLASKSSTEEWDLFYRNSREVLEDDGITKLLSLSYYDLPYHLRICLLYLSSFLGHAHIEKMTLIRLWIAEGFVQQRRDMTIEEVAESYLNELVGRCLLQVAEFKSDGKIKAIGIHDMIRQIILDKSMEQNITSILREQDQIMKFEGKVRRLAIHGFNISNIEQPENKFKSLRSLLVFEFNGDNTMQKSFLSSILRSSGRLVKVLDLRGASLTEIPDEVFNLIRLTYLSLRNTEVSIIPKSIRKLQNLETLDLKGTNVRRLPIQILELHQLRHLLVYNYNYRKGYTSTNVESCEMPYKISSLKSLQKLNYIEAEQVGDVKIVEEIGKLSQLRRLGITKLRKEDGIPLCSSLEKLIELRSLVIVSKGEEEIIDIQYSFSSSALTFLRVLQLRGRLEKFPQWISSLHGLTEVLLQGSRLSRDEDPLKFLQDLPNLVGLHLDRAYEGEGLNFRAGGFLRLKKLSLGSFAWLSSVMVEEGAMPSLEKLWISKCESMKEIPIGINNLVSLKDLRFLDMSDAFLEHLESLGNMSDSVLKHRGSVEDVVDAFLKHLESVEHVSDEYVEHVSDESVEHVSDESVEDVLDNEFVRFKAWWTITHVPSVVVALSNVVGGVEITHRFSHGVRLKSF